MSSLGMYLHTGWGGASVFFFGGFAFAKELNKSPFPCFEGAVLVFDLVDDCEAPFCVGCDLGSSGSASGFAVGSV